MKISDHISFKEAVRSNTATRKGIENTPPQEIIEKMKITAKNVFEPVRNHFGIPIRVNSFYRSVRLNQAIGGSPWSQHCKGEAIDIDDTIGGLTNKQMFNFIKSNVDFDQLIWEFGTNQNPAWIHVSYKSPEKNRKIILRAITNPKTKRAKYIPF